MLVNITQYRGSVEIFNNRNFVFRSKFQNFIDHKCWSSNNLYFKLRYTIFPVNLMLFLAFVFVLSSRSSRLSETYLDLNILPDDSNLEVPGYNFVCSYHPSNKKTWRCLYILQELLAFKNRRYQLFKRVYEV